MTALLAIASAGLIGGADFIGGIASWTASGIRVAAFAQAAGMPFAIALSIAYGADRVTRADVGWSVLAGVVVSIGLALFYTAMGRGLISVVAPVAALTGAVIPVVYGLLRGERPGTVAVVGLVIALVAVVVVSIAPGDPEHAAVTPTVIGMSFAAGVCFGLFYVCFSRISDDSGMWPVTLERATGTATLTLLAVALTRGRFSGARRLLPYVLAIGVLEVAATMPLLLALQRGPVAIASVLASLYPVMTVLLAGVVLRERLSKLQLAGVVCALVAVALVSSG